MSDPKDDLARRVAELEAENAALRTGARGLPFGEGLSEREALLAEAERIVQMGSWMWDSHSEVALWSDEFYRIWGLDPARVQPSSEAFLRGIHPDDLAMVHAATERGLATGNPEPVEFRVCRPDGTVRQVRMAAAIIRDTAGAPLRMVGTALDVTERRALEQQLLRSQRMEAIGTLAGGVAHDFNNYLLIIAGNADLLAQRAPRGGPLTEAIEEIRRACERCATLTRQLLTVGRKQVFDPRIFDVNEIAVAVQGMLERVVGEHITVEADLGEHLHAVRADPAQLEQAVLNLALNARDAMPRGGTLRLQTDEVSIDAAEIEQQPGLEVGPHVRIIVRDDGKGMPPEALARAFEPFFTTKPAGKGSGLGLSTVHGIVARAGGVVLLESEPGEGTVATILLPAVEASDERDEVPGEVAGDLRGTERILVVEDHPQVRHLVRTVLEQAGYAVIEAEDGADALDMAAADTGSIDLVLTDVVMPRMGGIELAQQLRHARPEAAVVFMSGHASPVAALEGLIEQGVTFVPKPFAPCDLLAGVRRALDERPR